MDCPKIKIEGMVLMKSVKMSKADEMKLSKCLRVFTTDVESKCHAKRLRVAYRIFKDRLSRGFSVNEAMRMAIEDAAGGRVKHYREALKLAKLPISLREL